MRNFNERTQSCGGGISLRRLMFLLLLCVCSAGAFAQSRVTGKVIDANGEPVIGASVMVKGTTNGAVTDLDGNYTISNVPSGASLNISYVGYRTQTIPVGGKQSINVTLEEDKQLLDEVVVVGYGVQRKSDVTGALTRLRGTAGQGRRCGYHQQRASRHRGQHYDSWYPFAQCIERSPLCG